MVSMTGHGHVVWIILTRGGGAESRKANKDMDLFRLFL